MEGLDPESDGGDDSVTVTDSTGDLSDLSASHYQGVMLLQKLQQLKVWQAAQEELLVREQQREINMRLEELDLTEDKMSVTGAEAEELDETDDTTEADAACESLAMDSPKSTPTLEERPVAGGGKTFEQLLAEKLAEDQRQQNNSKSPVTPKPFLKKFSGLSRFNINSPEPSNKTKSTPSGSGSTPVRKVSPIKDRKSSSKLLESNEKSKSSKHVSIVSPPRTLRLNPPRPAPAPAQSSFHYDLSDSVENSFCDKLVVQASRQQKDQAELAVFKMLETAADDSSFCSNSSRIQGLVTAAVLQSPQRQPGVSPGLQSSKSFVSSTPAPQFPSKLSFSSPAPDDDKTSSAPASADTGPHASPNVKGDMTEQTLGESIMDDIKKFLAARFVQEAQDKREKEEVNELEEDDTEWTDESEDDTTLENDEDVTIGRDWKENIPPPSKPSRDAEVLTFSPPDKLPPNAPSRLIWEIFGKENEKKRKEALKSKPVTEKNTLPRRRSAPLGVRFDKSKDNIGKQAGSESDDTEDSSITHQKTLLHMRVVELEQEISTFKQENKKIVSTKKKLQADKEKLANELRDFEELRTNERKKLDEEKRRIKRDMNLIEKSRKSQDKCKKCDELKSEKQKVDKDFKTKEAKLAEEVCKLKDQLKKLKKDNQELENENQKLKLRKVGSKVSFSEEREPEVVITNHKKEENVNQPQVKTATPDSDGESSTGVKIREKIFDDGHKEIWFSNGNRKEVSGDGRRVKVFYFNGDVKEVGEDGSERYLYSETQTWHIKMTDGTEIIQFSNGQQETKSRDGTTSISFPDGTVKTVTIAGRETIKFPDGTVQTSETNGDRRLEMPNGQVEEHTEMFKKRIYPDGTQKILHKDGRQETRYANGRVRIRDSLGNLTQDTG